MIEAVSGESLTLSVDAVVFDPNPGQSDIPSFQWQSGQLSSEDSFTNIPNATGVNLVIDPVDYVENSGFYRCKFTAPDADDVLGNIEYLNTYQTSGNVLLQPVDTAMANATGFFSTTGEISDGSQVSFQWQELNPISNIFENIVDATGTGLLIENIISSSSAREEKYRCQIISTGTVCKPTFTDIATLFVFPAVVTFDIQPTETTTVNGSGSFQVSGTVNDASTLNYEWFYNSGNSYYSTYVYDTGLIVTNMNPDASGVQYCAELYSEGTASNAKSNLATLHVDKPVVHINTNVTDYNATFDSSITGVAENSDSIVTEDSDTLLMENIRGEANFFTAASLSNNVHSDVYYQWQENNGLGWIDIEGEVLPYLQFKELDYGSSDIAYRAKISGDFTEAYYTDSGVLYIPTPTIDFSPQVTNNTAIFSNIDIYTEDSDIITLEDTNHILMDYKKGLAYFNTVTSIENALNTGIVDNNWEKYDSTTASWNTLEETQTHLYLDNVTYGNSGEQYRSVVDTNSDLRFVSNTGELLVDIPTITVTDQPSNQNVLDDAGIFGVTGTISELTELSYKWQKYVDADWEDFRATQTLNVSDVDILTAPETTSFRAVLSSVYPGITGVSATVTLTVPQISITEQPENTTMVNGSGLIDIAATVTDSRSLDFAWKKVSNQGVAISDWETGATLSSTTGLYLQNQLYSANNGDQYAAIVSVTSHSQLFKKSNIITITAPHTETITVSQQPTDQTYDYTADSVSFTISASSSGPGIAYQWQESADGITFTNTGTNSATLTLTGFNYTKNGYRYKCIVSANEAVTVISDVVTLTVPKPVITVARQPIDQNVNTNNGYPVIISLEASISSNDTLTYTWSKSDDETSTYSSTLASYETVNTEGDVLTVGYDNHKTHVASKQYKCTITSPYADTVVSNTITVTEPYFFQNGIIQAGGYGSTPITIPISGPFEVTYTLDTTINEDTDINYYWEVSRDNGSNYERLTNTRATSSATITHDYLDNGSRYRQVSVNRYLGEFRSAYIIVNLDVPEIFNVDDPNTDTFTIDIENFEDDMSILNNIAHKFKTGDTGQKCKAYWEIGFQELDDSNVAYRALALPVFQPGADFTTLNDNQSRHSSKQIDNALRIWDTSPVWQIQGYNYGIVNYSEAFKYGTILNGPVPTNKQLPESYISILQLDKVNLYGVPSTEQIDQEYPSGHRNTFWKPTGRLRNHRRLTREGDRAGIKDNRKPVSNPGKSKCSNYDDYTYSFAKIIEGERKNGKYSTNLFAELAFRLTIYPDRGLFNPSRPPWAYPTPSVSTLAPTDSIDTDDFDSVDCMMGGAIRPKKSYILRLNDVNNTFPQFEINKHNGQPAQTWKPGKTLNPGSMTTATAKVNYTNRLAGEDQDGVLTSPITDGTNDAVVDGFFLDPSKQSTHPILEIVFADENNPLIIKNTEKDIVVRLRQGKEGTTENLILFSLSSGQDAFSVKQSDIADTKSYILSKSRFSSNKYASIEFKRLPVSSAEQAANNNRPINKYAVKFYVDTRSDTFPRRENFRAIALFQCNGAVAMSSSALIQKVTAFKVNSLGGYSYNGGEKKSITDNTSYTNPDGTQVQLGTYGAILIKPKMSTLVYYKKGNTSSATAIWNNTTSTDIIPIMSQNRLSATFRVAIENPEADRKSFRWQKRQRTFVERQEGTYSANNRGTMKPSFEWVTVAEYVPDYSKTYFDQDYYKSQSTDIRIHGDDIESYRTEWAGNTVFSLTYTAPTDLFSGKVYHEKYKNDDDTLVDNPHYGKEVEFRLAVYNNNNFQGTPTYSSIYTTDTNNFYLYNKQDDMQGPVGLINNSSYINGDQTADLYMMPLQGQASTFVPNGNTHVSMNSTPSILDPRECIFLQYDMYDLIALAGNGFDTYGDVKRRPYPDPLGDDSYNMRSANVDCNQYSNAIIGLNNIFMGCAVKNESLTSDSFWGNGGPSTRNLSYQERGKFIPGELWPVNSQCNKPPQSLWQFHMRIDVRGLGLTKYINRNKFTSGSFSWNQYIQTDLTKAGATYTGRDQMRSYLAIPWRTSSNGLTKQAYSYNPSYHVNDRAMTLAEQLARRNAILIPVGGTRANLQYRKDIGALIPLYNQGTYDYRSTGVPYIDIMNRVSPLIQFPNWNDVLQGSYSYPDYATEHTTKRRDAINYRDLFGQVIRQYKTGSWNGSIPVKIPVGGSEVGHPLVYGPGVLLEAGLITGQTVTRGFGRSISWFGHFLPTNYIFEFQPIGKEDVHRQGPGVSYLNAGDGGMFPEDGYERAPGFNRKPIAWDKRLRDLPINVQSFPNRPGYVNILHGITYAETQSADNGYSDYIDNRYLESRVGTMLGVAPLPSSSSGETEDYRTNTRTADVSNQQVPIIYKNFIYIHTDYIYGYGIKSYAFEQEATTNSPHIGRIGSLNNLIKQKHPNISNPSFPDGVSADSSDYAGFAIIPQPHKENYVYNVHLRNQINQHIMTKPFQYQLREFIGGKNYPFGIEKDTASSSIIINDGGGMGLSRLNQYRMDKVDQNRAYAFLWAYPDDLVLERWIESFNAKKIVKSSISRDDINKLNISKGSHPEHSNTMLSKCNVMYNGKPNNNSTNFNPGATWGTITGDRRTDKYNEFLHSSHICEQSYSPAVTTSLNDVNWFVQNDFVTAVIEAFDGPVDEFNEADFDIVYEVRLHWPEPKKLSLPVDTLFNMTHSTLTGFQSYNQGIKIRSGQRGGGYADTGRTFVTTDIMAMWPGVNGCPYGLRNIPEIPLPYNHERRTKHFPFGKQITSIFSSFDRNKDRRIGSYNVLFPENLYLHHAAGADVDSDSPNPELDQSSSNGRNGATLSPEIRSIIHEWLIGNEWVQTPADTHKAEPHQKTTWGDEDWRNHNNVTDADSQHGQDAAMSLRYEGSAIPREKNIVEGQMNGPHGLEAFPLFQHHTSTKSIPISVLRQQIKDVCLSIIYSDEHRQEHNVLSVFRQAVQGSTLESAYRIPAFATINFKIRHRRHNTLRNCGLSMRMELFPNGIAQPEQNTGSHAHLWHQRRDKAQYIMEDAAIQYQITYASEEYEYDSSSAFLPAVSKIDERRIDLPSDKKDTWFASHGSRTAASWSSGETYGISEGNANNTERGSYVGGSLYHGIPYPTYGQMHNESIGQTENLPGGLQPDQSYEFYRNGMTVVDGLDHFSPDGDRGIYTGHVLGFDPNAPSPRLTNDDGFFPWTRKYWLNGREPLRTGRHYIPGNYIVLQIPHSRGIPRSFLAETFIEITAMDTSYLGEMWNFTGTEHDSRNYVNNKYSFLNRPQLMMTTQCEIGGDVYAKDNKYGPRKLYLDNWNSGAVLSGAATHQFYTDYDGRGIYYYQNLGTIPMIYAMFMGLSHQIHRQAAAGESFATSQLAVERYNTVLQSIRGRIITYTRNSSSHKANIDRRILAATEFDCSEAAVELCPQVWDRQGNNTLLAGRTGYNFVNNDPNDPANNNGFNTNTDFNNFCFVQPKRAADASDANTGQNIKLKPIQRFYLANQVSTAPIHPADVFIPNNAGDSSGFYKGF